MLGSRLSRFRSLFVVLVLMAGLLIAALPTDAARSTKLWEIPDDAVPAQYIESIDGDTFDARVMQENGQWREERIRMIGIDTPETNYSYGKQSHLLKR